MRDSTELPTAAMQQGGAEIHRAGIQWKINFASMGSKPLEFEQHARGFFDHRFDPLEKQHGFAAVDDAMIVG